MEIWETWKLGKLEVWRLGNLEKALEPIYGPILGAYRKRFGNPGSLEARKPRDLAAGRPRSLGRVAKRIRDHPRTL